MVEVSLAVIILFVCDVPHSTQDSWVARNTCEQDVEPLRGLRKILHVGLTTSNPADRASTKGRMMLAATPFAAFTKKSAHTTFDATTGGIIICPRQKQTRSSSPRCRVYSITNIRETLESTTTPCPEPRVVVPYLVKVCDVVDDLRVVRNNRVELFKGLERVARQAQVNVYQPQVKYGLHTVHLRGEYRQKRRDS